MDDETSSTTTPRQRNLPRLLFQGLAILALLLVAALLGSTFWARSFVRGEAFRKFLDQQTSRFLRADGAFMPLHWEGWSVYSDGFAARGTSRSAFTELRADQVRADIQLRGIFRRAWEVSHIDIQRMRTSLGGVPVVAADGMGHNVTREPSHSMPRFAGWLPTRVELRRITIQETELHWNESRREAGSIQKVRATLVPDGNAWLIHGTGGILRQAGWPELAVDHLQLRYRHPQLFVTEAQFRQGDAGTIDVTGEFDFDAPARLNLQARMANLPVTPLLPTDWRARLHGNLVGDVIVTGPLSDPDSITANGSLGLISGRLEALPVLERIAQFTGTDQFRQFALRKATADFSWTNSRLAVSHLYLESEGLIRVEGGFVLRQRVLDGTFQVGVTASSLRWLPGSRTKVFTTERDGYLWTTMRVSGPVDRLQEDLSPRLVEAAGTEVIEGVKGAVEKGAQDLLNLLLPPAP